ncbi:MAG: hypothetical protein ISS95_01110 [Candidatus Aenigmarchaeota archaeon]|nr:hypothetical protein [Candidatus Aenigmarchaeota archaeon]
MLYAKRGVETKTKTEKCPHGLKYELRTITDGSGTTYSCLNWNCQYTDCKAAKTRPSLCFSRRRYR